MAGALQFRGADGRTHPIDAPVRIGRDPTCQIHLDDGLVSRVHATVWPEGGALRIRDEGSSNGTFFNGNRLKPGQIYNLRAGDSLRVGHASLTVEPAPQTAVPQPAAYAVPVPPPPTAAERARAASPATIHMPMPPRPAQVAPTPPARRRSSLPALAMGGCALLALLLVCGAGGLFALQRPPMLQTALAQIAPQVASGPTGTPGVAVTLAPEDIRLTILPAVPPPTPLPPEAFAANQQSLAAAVAELNQAELDFIHKALAQARGPAGHISRRLRQFNVITEDDFAFIEQKALKVYVQVQQQGQTVAAQGGGNDPAAAALADVYAVLAQQALALTVKVDALRSSWLDGTMGVVEAASLMAQYSAAVWNPAITEPGVAGNPFAAYAPDPGAILEPAPISPQGLEAIGMDPYKLGWLSAGNPDGTDTIRLPPLEDPPPASLMDDILEPGSQLVGVALGQVAAAQLVRIASPSDQTLGTVTVLKQALVVADPQAAGGGNALLSFANGQSALITQAENAGATELTGTLLGVDGNNTPTVIGQTPIDQAPPVVALTLSNLSIKQVNKRPKDAFQTFEADVLYEFDVQWQSGLVAPQFALDCVSGNHFDITTAAGQQHINAKGLLILYPGAEDAFCYASRNGNTLGGASIHFLVGDAAEATQRAIQVETDSAALDMTLTAYVLGTQAAEQTNAASTRSVEQTADAVGTEVGGTQTAEFRLTVTALAANEGAGATQTAAALGGDKDGDGVILAEDRCPEEKETQNNWRDQDGCPDKLPVVNLNASFTENVTNGPVGAFGSTATLVLDYGGGTVSGTQAGSATWSASYFCYNTSNSSEIYETVGASYTGSYTAQVGGSANQAGGAFDATLAATGVTRIRLSTAFTHEECTHLNSSNLDDHWFGGGSVTGTWDGNTFGSLITDWDVESVHFAGTWSGTVSATEP